MELLSVRGLTKTYPKFTLQQVDMALEEGRIMGLIGKNGAGKSTCIKSMLHMVCPDCGEIRMFGEDYREREEQCKQKIGVVFGGIDYYRHKKLSTITSVTRRFYEHWDSDAYEKCLDLFALDPQKRIDQLSAGMQVKYAITLALSHHARLFILDEPTSGLDPVARDEILSIFKALVRDGKKSILFSTHITSDLEKCADDITYIQNGRILKSAPKEEFLQSFQNLKEEGESGKLTLEEIMVRTERRNQHVSINL